MDALILGYTSQLFNTFLRFVPSDSCLIFFSVDREDNFLQYVNGEWIIVQKFDYDISRFSYVLNFVGTHKDIRKIYSANVDYLLKFLVQTNGSNFSGRFVQFSSKASLHNQMCRDVMFSDFNFYSYTRKVSELLVSNFFEKYTIFRLSTFFSDESSSFFIRVLYNICNHHLFFCDSNLKVNFSSIEDLNLIFSNLDISGDNHVYDCWSEKPLNKLFPKGRGSIVKIDFVFRLLIRFNILK
jgi:hypothetical protein